MGLRKSPYRRRTILLRSAFMVAALMIGLSLLAGTLLMGNQNKTHVSDGFDFAFIFARHDSFDAQAWKIALTEQAWFANNIQLVWIDEQTPYLDFGFDQVPLFQVSPQGYCTNRSFMMKTIINDMIASSPESSVFLARFVINDPSSNCDHYLAVHQIDAPKLPKLPAIKPNMVRPYAPCAKEVDHILSVHALQSNMTDLARTEFALDLQWSLQYISQRTLHTSVRCITNDATDDALFKIINYTLAHFKHNSTELMRNIASQKNHNISSLRGALYLTTKNMLHVYFEP